MAYEYGEIIKAFRNEAEGVVPVSFWKHFTPSEFIDGLKHKEVSGINLAGHKQFVQDVNPDFVKTMSDGYFIDPTARKIKSINNLDEITELDVDNAWFLEQIELAQQQKAIAGARPTFYTVFSPLTVLKWVLINHDTEDLQLADERFANYYEENPRAVKRALHIIASDTKKLVDQLGKTELTGVFYSTQSIQDSRVKNLEFFKEVIEPTDLDVITTINSNFEINILHICGFDGATNNLEWFKDYPLQVINWATHVDNYTLGEGKKLFHNKAVLGGFGNEKEDVLFSGNKEEIQNEAREIIQEAGKKGVIIGADCTVSRDIPLEHIKWVEDIVHTL